MEVKDLNPKILWKNFYDLNQVPRPSKKEERVRNFMKEFAVRVGLKAEEDNTGNILIRKPATEGCENSKTIVLQSHLDMVHQKNNDTEFNFDEDPIKMKINGEWVKAQGTTLGADNGIGVAAAMAVLESKDLSHGPIEAIFTIDEETGMTGAFGLESNWLKGDYLLNMDSEDEGELYIGCAGGIDYTATYASEKTEIPENGKLIELRVKGLKGGHSGMDIVLNLGNANKILGALLNSIIGLNFRLCSLEGGNLRNAIPRESNATLWVHLESHAELVKRLNEREGQLKDEFKNQEPTLSVEIKETTYSGSAISSADTFRLCETLNAFPNGVQMMSHDIENLVETSLNLSKTYLADGIFKADFLIRSSVEPAKHNLVSRLDSLVSLSGGESATSGNYPGWQPDPKSNLLAVMKEVHKNSYGYDPEIKAVHAGLECGVIKSIYPNMEMISFGPTIRGAHSPDERVEIATVERFWNFLVDALEELCVK